MSDLSRHWTLANTNEQLAKSRDVLLLAKTAFSAAFRRAVVEFSQLFSEFDKTHFDVVSQWSPRDVSESLAALGVQAGDIVEIEVDGKKARRLRVESASGYTWDPRHDTSDYRKDSNYRGDVTLTGTYVNSAMKVLNQHISISQLNTVKAEYILRVIGKDPTYVASVPAKWEETKTFLTGLSAAQLSTWLAPEPCCKTAEHVRLALSAFTSDVDDWAYISNTAGRSYYDRFQRAERLSKLMRTQKAIDAEEEALCERVISRRNRCYRKAVLKAGNFKVGEVIQSGAGEYAWFKVLEIVKEERNIVLTGQYLTRDGKPRGEITKRHIYGPEQAERIRENSEYRKARNPLSPALTE